MSSATPRLRLSSPESRGSNSISSSAYMDELIRRDDQIYFDEAATARVKDVIIINNKWQVWDSLNPDFQPTTGPNGENIYKNLADLPGLPPLKEGAKLGDDIAHFPNATSGGEGDDEARAIPIETTSEGRWYIMVLLRNDQSEAARRARTSFNSYFDRAFALDSRHVRSCLEVYSSDRKSFECRSPSRGWKSSCSCSRAAVGPMRWDSC